jgi:HK97 family phage portal protein
MLQSAPAGSVTPGTALTVGDAYACVRVLADAAASVPLIPYRRTQNGRERVEGGRLVELLQRPAPATTQAGLVGQIVAHLNTYGNAYLGKFRRDGALDQLALLAPDRVQPEIRGGRPLYTLTGPMGEQSVHGTDDIVHIKALTTDGLVGLSPVRQARTVLGLSDQLAEHAATFFANDASPRGVLKLQRFGDSTEQVDSLKAQWNAGHKGTENAHKIAIISGEVDFLPVSMPLDDAQFLEQRKLSAVEVARIFRVPPHLIGADTGESMTYSNLETAAIEFVTYSLRPWLVAIEQAITNDPDLCSERQYVEFLLDSLLRADHATRAEVYAKALDPITGWMTHAEVRKRENLDPEPEQPTPSKSSVAQLATATASPPR